MAKIRLDVQPDHLEDVARTRPILGLAELIWNAVDADANNVSVTYRRNDLGGIEGVTVTDDGHGIDHFDAVTAFGNLGGSRKKTQRVSQSEQRALHGQEGKGRFKAFCIGNSIEWSSTYKYGQSIRHFRIVGKRPALNQFEVTDTINLSKGKLGTVVEISDLRDGVDSLASPQKVTGELARRLAIYLRKYPSVRIDIEGILVDPSSVESHAADYGLPDIILDDGRTFNAKLNIIEWTVPTERALYLCDSSGFAKEERPPGIKAPGWNFTAYLASDLVPDLENRGAFALEELHPDYVKLMDAARRQMREHFTKRAAEAAASVVEGWKKDGVYPYGGSPKDLMEQTERQVFDVVALQLAEALPDFEESDTRSKRLSMRLLKQAIEKSPEELQSIFTEVLGLSQEKQIDLADLLKRTSLSSIISAAKLVSGRLDFLRGLELLLFHPLSNEQLLERTQLHKIVEDHTWLWGEEYALSASDQSLNDVLDIHMDLLGQRSDDDSTVLREDGSRGIVDLMLSRRIPQVRDDEREHLVIELKRPSVIADSSTIDQVESYAFAVARDQRFKNSNTRWVFWLLCNDMKDSAHRKANRKGQPPGLVGAWDDPRIEIWSKRWMDVIDGNRARLGFMQKRLEYRVDDVSALETLRKLHSKYLPPVFADSKT